MNITLLNISNSRHLEQIYTGFSILAKKGLINITHQYYSAPSLAKGLGHPILYVTINDKINIVYDLADTQDLTIPDALANNVHYYFKRSFKIAHNYHLNNTEFFPLGFNYLVFSNYDNLLFQRIKIEPSIQGKIDFFIRQSTFLSNILSINNSSSNCSINDLQSPPRLTTDPQIIFLCRTWPEDRAKTDNKKQHRFEVNQMRAKCIQQLKKEFGSKCISGFYIDEYTKKNYPNCLISDNSITLKKNYINLVKKSSICIATTGLEYSTGWKFGEYVALSKAIISEELYNEVPGNFEAGRNYLEFQTPDECIEKTWLLMQNEELRFEIMNNNYNYYQDYLQPDILVWNTLKKATSKS